MALASSAPAQVLPSWNQGTSRSAIVEFVTKVTTEGTRDFVPARDRIAVFDNDGTLWAEQPMYFQFQFALDRVRAMAPDHPEWKGKPPFGPLLDGDLKAYLAQGEKAILAAVAASHAGMTTDAFQAEVKKWLETARHPSSGLPYTKMAYAPMIELLDYLRANGFRTYIVSGGGVEFIRCFAESTYGIPPEQVVGSQGKLEYRAPTLVKLADVQFVDDGPGKPAGIQVAIGRRPLAAFGNSDGDREMLEWTTAGDGPRFALLVHHTDEAREFAYDRVSPVGKLDKALDQARASGWTVVDMKNDWKKVFAD
jgi:phosphoglycolate phosphatase-like HAD superfamily hydrolase